MGIQIMMNKKGLEFKSAFFAILAMSIFVIAMSIHLTQWDVNDAGAIYSSGITSDVDLEEYDKLDAMRSTSSSQRGGLSPEDYNPGSGDFEGSTFKAVFGILMNIFAPFEVVFGEGGMIDSVTDQIGLPDYVRWFIVAIMTFAIIFSLIAIIFRLPRGST